MKGTPYGWSARRSSRASARPATRLPGDRSRAVDLKSGEVALARAARHDARPGALPAVGDPGIGDLGVPNFGGGC